ncbi:hypothetical protein [Plasmodium yoelii yoelii]|uniref:Uncharacterized protein n=1 Tax=Plasmodium yoelii yoelii TaxID=73239 RepID=Q7RSM6_PLAYO|nr:hypothetical protein [Plasmodium yoelii yoelii]
MLWVGVEIMLWEPMFGSDKTYYLYHIYFDLNYNFPTKLYKNLIYEAINYN